MGIKASEIVKSLTSEVNRRGEDGQEVPYPIVVKYRPITQAWLNKWDETRLSEYLTGQTFSKLLSELADAQRQLEQAGEAERAECQAKVDEAQKRLDEHQTAHPAPEYDFLTRQMADLLTEVGYDGDDGKPLPITCENLVNIVDRELLRKIEAQIQKKLSRQEAT